MGRKKTIDEFKKEVNILTGDEYEICGEYINTETKIKMRHTICGNEFEMAPHNFLNKHRCPICSHWKKTTKSFKKEVFNLVGSEYQLISEYINSDTRVEFLHTVCGNNFEIFPNNFLKGYRCPLCTPKNYTNRSNHSKHPNYSNKKTTEKFKQEVYDLVQNQYEVVGEYIGSNDKIKMKHNKCGRLFEMEPNNFLHGHRCPRCKYSKGEEYITKFLDKHSIHYIPQKKFKGLLGTKNGSLSYDFYLPNHNLLIEYQGQQHDNPIALWGGEKQYKNQKENDNRKRKFAYENNIKLLEIWYYDFENIETILQRELLKNSA